MDYRLIGIGVVLLAYLLQMHFRFKKIEIKLIELDMRLTTIEHERSQESSGEKS